jgi:hypothetical protein
MGTDIMYITGIVDLSAQNGTIFYADMSKRQRGGFMKRLMTGIVFTVAVFFLSAVVFANSGPVFWQGYPSSDIMSVDRDSPIKVEKENLVFDFSDSDYSAYTVSGRVTATYQMVNPTNEPQSVQMAFPFAGAIDRFTSGDIVITAGDSVLPFYLYAGDVVDSYLNPRQEDKKVSYDFAGIVNTITDQPYKADNFKENEKGRLYIIKVKPTTDQRINFAVDFTFDHEKTKVLTKGFNRYEREEQKVRIAAWCYKPQVLEILVLGQDIDLELNAYTDGELSQKTLFFTHQITAQEVELKPYLMESMKKNTNAQNNNMISDIQLYNLYAASLDKCFTQNMGFGSEYDLTAQENYQRILTLVYTVEFPPNSPKEVSVSYKTSGTMDKTKTTKPLYTFDYILNAAQNWSGFKNLNIEIIPPQEAPYITESSIELTKGENGVYTAALADLPGEDLSFTLYANEKITLLDKVGGSLQGSFGYFTPIVIGAALLLIIGVTIMAAICRRKRGL